MTAILAGNGAGGDAGNGIAKIRSVNDTFSLVRRCCQKESDAILRLMLPVWYR